jgi:hypothetical protein
MSLAPRAGCPGSGRIEEYETAVAHTPMKLGKMFVPPSSPAKVQRIDNYHVELVVTVSAMMML